MRRSGVLAGVALLSLSLLSGCSGGGGKGSVTPPTTGGNLPLTVVMTDTPPVGVTVVSFQATVTGVVLNPGALPLLSGPIPIELKHLESESAFIATTQVPAGTYSSITLSFSNVQFTFKNDSGATLLGCALGGVCKATPGTAASVPFSAAPFPLTFSGNTPVGLLVDVNLNNILSSTLSVDFNAPGGVTVTQLPSAQPTGQLAKLEEVVGQVTAKDVTASQFTLQTALQTLTVAVDGATVFEDFLNAGCSSANFACVLVNQIVDVHLTVLGNGTLRAEKVELHDRDGTEPEVEAIIVSLGPGAPPTPAQIVALGEVPNVTGLAVGDSATIGFSTVTTFSVDGDGLNFTGLSFGSSGDLLVGQEIQVQRLLPFGTTTVAADRILLRQSTLTAQVNAVLNATDFTVDNLASLFTSAGISSIEVRTSSLTGFDPSTITVSSLKVGDTVSLRGLLFRRSATNPVLVTSKVRKR